MDRYRWLHPTVLAVSYFSEQKGSSFSLLIKQFAISHIRVAWIQFIFLTKKGIENQALWNTDFTRKMNSSPSSKGPKYPRRQTLTI